MGLHNISYDFSIWPTFQGQRGKSLIFSFLTYVTLKSRSNETCVLYVMYPTKYTYSKNCVMLALIVTSEMALVRFWLMPPWRPHLESDRAEIWHTHSGCLDTSSHQIIAL
jgi:hypothetical protein